MAMNDPDLLPCPFCGGRMFVGSNPFYWYSECSDCGAQGPALVRLRASQDRTADVIEASNRRASKAAVPTTPSDQDSAEPVE